MIRDRTYHLAVLVILVAAIALQGNVAAAETALPSTVAAGFDAYKSGGPQAAMTAWLKGSPLETDKQAQSQSAMLLQIETYYGKFISASPLGSFEPSPGVTLTFAGLKYEKGPVFARFMTFRTGDKEAIVVLKFHTNPEEILPSQLLYKSK
jgi:hypothetical protein